MGWFTKKSSEFTGEDIQKYKTQKVISRPEFLRLLVGGKNQESIEQRRYLWNYRRDKFGLDSLKGLKLDGLNFSGFDFTGADLRDVDFSYAVLIGANFTKANLKDAKFKKAKIENAIFDDVKNPPSELKNLSENEDKGFITVRKGLVVAKELSYKGKDWNDCKELLKNEKCRMLTILEFVEFLRFCRDHKEYNYIFNEITEVRGPWKMEWLDAVFTKDKKGNILINGEKLDEDILMQDRTKGIDLNEWLNSSTKQGLPHKNIVYGLLYYYYPREGAVARFDAISGGVILSCSRDPSNSDPALGVRRAKIL